MYFSGFMKISRVIFFPKGGGDKKKKKCIGAKSLICCENCKCLPGANMWKFAICCRCGSLLFFTVEELFCVVCSFPLDVWFLEKFWDQCILMPKMARWTILLNNNSKACYVTQQNAFPLQCWIVALVRRKDSINCVLNFHLVQKFFTAYYNTFMWEYIDI